MVEPVGKKLAQARLARGLTIEEVAHATRLRPEMIIGLESDDYSRFGSNAYAKGFLKIYGRHLGVDVSWQVKALEIPHQVSVAEYQYLNSAPEPPNMRVPTRRELRPPSMAPAIVFMGIVLTIGVVFWFNVNAQRLGLTGNPGVETVATVATPTPTPAQPNATTAPKVVDVAPAAVEASTPRPASNTTPAENQEASEEPRNNTPTEVRADSSAGATDQSGSATAAAEVPAQAPRENELVVESLKKTWVKIRKDHPNSTPVFEDFVYPGSQPITLRGPKFFVEVNDQTAVQIRQNGQPIAYHAPGISIP